MSKFTVNLEGWVFTQSFTVSQYSAVVKPIQEEILYGKVCQEGEVTTPEGQSKMAFEVFSNLNDSVTLSWLDPANFYVDEWLYLLQISHR